MAKFKATFLKRDKWWIAWSEDVPGALTQGETLDEARDNLRDAIALMQEDIDVSKLPDSDVELVQEEIEV